MTDERIEFDIGKARASMARFRADLESIDRIYKKLQDAVDGSGSWWTGKSHRVFRDLALVSDYSGSNSFSGRC